MSLTDLGVVTFVLVVCVAVLVVVAAWCSWTAGRLDRLHLRCEGARSALDAALARRRALALEVAAQPDTDPATSVLLVDAATRDPGSEQGWQQESDLSAVLRAVWPTGGMSPPWADLAAAGHRVSLSRRIHNDLAASTQALRSRRRVRWFRLAGHATAPRMIAFDDEPPV